MDMKKILAAVDQADKKDKTSSTDMKKFLSIVNESTTNRLSVAEQMAVQHYQEPRNDITSPILNKSKDSTPSMIGKYFKKVEEEIKESEQRYKDRAQLLAERVVAKMNEKTADVDAAVKDYLSKGGEVTKGKSHKPRKSEKTDFGSKHIAMKGEIGKGKAGRIGKAAKIDPSGKPVVSKEDLEHLIRIRDNLNEQISQLEEYYSAPPTDSRSPISGPHQPGCKMDKRMKGIEGASKRVSGQKPTSKNEGVQKTGPAGQLKGKDKVKVQGTVLGSPEKSQKGLRNKLVGGGT